MTFDMGRTWSRGIELVKENFRLLAIIAGIFLLLPTLAAYLLIPGLQDMMEPGADPEKVAEMLLANLGPLIGFVVVAIVFQFAGYGAMVALMGDTRPTVGEAIKRGFAITPSTFGILLLFMLGYFILSLIAMVPISLLAAAVGAPGLAALGAVVVLVVVVWLLARMCMGMQVLVFEDTLNPVTSVKRSFALTKPAQWRILGFWAVLTVAYIVIALLASSIFTLLGAALGNGVAGMLVVGLTNGIMAMIVGMIVCGLAVAMYGQLAGPSEASIAETFD